MFALRKLLQQFFHWLNSKAVLGRRRKRSHGFSPCRAEILECRALLAATIQLPLNINTTTTGLNNPSMLTPVGDQVFFSAADQSHGNELWKTTSSGTSVLVKDINPETNGSDPQNLTNVNGVLFFTATDGVHGTELWKSDGTSAGTVRVSDIGPGQFDPYFHSLTNVNGTLFFTARDSSHGIELWKSDGTSSGTVIVKDIQAGVGSSSPTQLTDVSGTLFFTADDGTHGYELWKSDGTAAGTVLVKDIVSGSFTSSPTGLTNVNGTLFFAARDTAHGVELWKSNGSSAGTVLVSDIWAGASGSMPNNLTNVNGTLYFSANKGTYVGQELWKSDGTVAGTIMVRKIGLGFNGSYPSNLTNVGGTLYFTADDGLNGRDIWKSDGTSSGTVLIKDLDTGTHYNNSPYGGPSYGPYPNSSYASNLTNLNGVLYYAASDGTHGTELWKSDGTAAGTTMVLDIRPGSDSSLPQPIVVAGGKLYFTAEMVAGDRELWTSDGTSSGTRVVAPSPAPQLGSLPLDGIQIGGITYFTADDGVHGRELWKTDGSIAGTVMVRDIQAGSAGSSPTALTNVNGVLYFSADDGVHGQELWKSNGTAAGTVMVKDIRTSTLGSFPERLTNVNGTLFFMANDGTTGTELWKSNGTAAGTVLVRDLNPGFYSIHGYDPHGNPVTYGPIPDPSNIANMTNVNGVLYFTATDGTHGNELWKSDGTTAGTVLVRGVNAGDKYDGGNGYSFSPTNLVNVNGTLYFAANDPKTGNELWKTDGTSAGTVLVRDIATGATGSAPMNLTSVGGTLYFTANDGQKGTELWKSDGTALGTVIVADLFAGSTGSYPSQLTNNNGTLYFSADNGVQGRELWRTNGTSAGTTLVKDIQSSGDSSPAQLTVFNGQLYFVADDGIHGRELWQTDGTSAGTNLVRDINQQATGSSIAIIAASSTTLFFAADDGFRGQELWTLEPKTNTAPVLDATKSPVLTSIGEDPGTPVGAVGTPVSRLVDLTTPSGQLDNVVDPDHNALLGIAITGWNTAQGVLYFSTDGGATWGGVGTVNDTSARLLSAAPSNRLYFKPNANFNGTIASAITFRAWDGTNGVDGRNANVTVNGGSTAFSTQQDTASLVVAPVNDAPVLTGAVNPTSITEDQTNNTGNLVSSLIAGKVTDVDANSTVGIALTSASAVNGRWQYSSNSGSTWIDVGSVSVTSALLLRPTDRLRFVPDAKNGVNASVTFRAWDQTSGAALTKVSTANSGGSQAFSSSQATASLVVTSINDAPILTSGTYQFAAMTEDQTGIAGTPVQNLISGKISDVDAGALAGIAIKGQTGAYGKWQFSLNAGTSWADLGTVSATTALLLRSTDLIRFASDGTNGTTATLSFSAWDRTTGTQGTKVDASVGGGTAAFSAVTDSASIVVTSINDAPVLKSGSIILSTITEDQTTNAGYVVSDILLAKISDVDANALSGIAITSTANGTGKWQFTTNGGTTWTDVGTVSATSSLLLRSTDSVRFVPDQINGTTASITFRGWDQTQGTAGTKISTSTNGGTTAFSSVSVTANLTVLSANDSPVLSGANNFTTITRTQTNNMGDLVSTLIAGKVTDVDPGALKGIAITSVGSGNSHWQYSLDNGVTWINLDTAYVYSSLLLRSTDRLRFVPDGTHPTTASITFRAWDQTSGSAGTSLNTTGAGGGRAVSSAQATSTLTVT